MKARGYYSGQSLSDYALVLGLVSLVAIGGLTIFGSQVSGLLGGMIRTGNGAPGGSAPATAPVVASTVTPSALPTVFPPAAFSNVPSTRITLPIAGGPTLGIRYNDAAAVVETVGADGATGNALAVIEQIISQLEGKPGQEELISELRDLAERGHALKDAQRRLVELLKPTTNQYTGRPTMLAATPAGSQEFMQYYHDFKNSMEAFKPTEAQIHEVLRDPRLQGSITGGDAEILSREAISRSLVDELRFAAFVKSGSTADNDGAAPTSKLQQFMAQLNLFRQSEAAKRNPDLERLITQSLARDVYAASMMVVDTNTMRDPKAQATFISVVKERSNDICTESRFTTCQKD